jgi:DNA-binding NarL/FixJ family response regulator
MQLQINYMNDFVCEVAWNNLHSFPGSGKSPDLVILDCEFYPVIASAPATWSDTKWMVLVKEESNQQLIDALFTGANAFFLLKNEPAELFASIIKLVGDKEDADIVRLIRNFSKPHKFNTDSIPDNLTNKEKDILSLMTHGLHFKAIAMQTGNTYETIRTHVKRIYKKLEVETASQAIVKALNIYNK